MTRPDSEQGLRSLYRTARAMTASPLLYVGAVTVVAANEFVELLVEGGYAGETVAVVAMIPVTLALLYAQLLALAYYRRGREGEPRGRCGADA